jgi:23S rRNA (guanine745-N1)-methyltransferase
MNRLLCPVCRGKLKKEGKNLCCINGHNFDIAKQGYVNLHMSGKKASKNPGDDRAMVIARREFLNSGFYEGISVEVNKAIVEYLKNKKEAMLVDIGCGEGYYTERLRKYIGLEGIVSDVYALDVSKEAVIQGAKEYKNINWLVASAMEMPFEDGEADVALAMFSKVFGSEYARILKEDGILVVVSPNRNHLLELKEVVYDKIKFESYNPMVDLDGKFNHFSHINVNYKKELNDSKVIMDLFNMTPYRWRSPREGIERLQNTDRLQITVDVNIDIYVKNR